MPDLKLLYLETLFSRIPPKPGTKLTAIRPAGTNKIKAADLVAELVDADLVLSEGIGSARRLSAIPAIRKNDVVEYFWNQVTTRQQIVHHLYHNPLLHYEKIEAIVNVSPAQLRLVLSALETESKLQATGKPPRYELTPGFKTTINDALRPANAGISGTLNKNAPLSEDSKMPAYDPNALNFIYGSRLPTDAAR